MKRWFGKLGQGLEKKIGSSENVRMSGNSFLL